MSRERSVAGQRAAPALESFCYNVKITFTKSDFSATLRSQSVGSNVHVLVTLLKIIKGYGPEPPGMPHMQNLKTALTSSLGRFRGSGDGVKNNFLIVFKIWESFSYG